MGPRPFTKKLCNVFWINIFELDGRWERNTDSKTRHNMLKKELPLCTDMLSSHLLSMLFAANSDAENSIHHKNWFGRGNSITAVLSKHLKSKNNNLLLKFDLRKLSFHESCDDWHFSNCMDGCNCFNDEHLTASCKTNQFVT